MVLQLNVVVSGALDRLHSEKDPCVKYDVNRKIWIYLHRCRTEEEFGKVLTIFPPFSSNACFLINLCTFEASVANNMDPDQTAPLKEQSDLGSYSMIP